MAATKTEKKKRPAVPNPFSGDRRGDISLSFFAYVMILLVVGIVMMSSASYAWAYSEHGGDGLYYAKNQAKNAVIGFVAMIFFMKMDYHNFKNLKLPVLKKLNMQGLRVYLQGDNLFLLTPYPGWDPEVSNNMDPRYTWTDNLNVPQPRTFTFGVNLSF